METKYYLGKKYYAVVEWDGKETSDLVVVQTNAPSSWNFGCFVGQFKSKFDAWQALADASELRVFCEKNHVSCMQAAYQLRDQQRQNEPVMTSNRVAVAYDNLISKGLPIDCSWQNVQILLAYLNTKNWGGWELPPMTIGYRCNQYDCDGKIATTIILDSPIDYYGEKVSRFVYGAPHGHLTKYHRI